MTAFTKQPYFISMQYFSKYVCDDAVCREEENKSVGYLVGREILVKSELRVHRVWIWKVGGWYVEDRKDHQRVQNDLKVVMITGLSTVQDS